MTDRSEKAEWSGNRKAFEFPSGGLLKPGGDLDNLERVLAHQAALCGAEFTIEDLGGEAHFWTDEIIVPE